MANVLCELKVNFSFRCSNQCTSVISDQLMILLSSNAYMLISCLLNWFTSVGKVLKISSDNGGSTYFSMQFYQVLLLAAYTLGISLSSWNIDPFIAK